jgi:hypothetical protein
MTWGRHFLLALLIALVSTFVILYVAAETAKAHAPWNHPPCPQPDPFASPDPCEILQAPWLHYLKFLRADVNQRRADKCLPDLQRQYEPPRAVPASLRRAAVRVERDRRLPRVKAAASQCLSNLLWDWYETSGADCIHSYEGSWDANTGNGYWGGFQADLAFQRAYGPEYLRRFGTANNWPVISQIHMAYRGYQARGWSPWPNTSRVCGLL